MEKLKSGVETSLFDFNNSSDMYYQHMLINNRDHTMLNTIKRLLEECDEFYFSAAFVTKGGVQLLRKAIYDAKLRGVKGKVVTGNYLYFSDPNAIAELNSFENVELRIDCQNNLHTKGYFFKIKDEWKIIIGSSNLTVNALMKNNEWNLLVTSKDSGKIVHDSIATFDQLFESSNEFDDVIVDYIEKFSNKKEYNKQFNNLVSSDFNTDEIKPNNMQVEAMKSLKELRSIGENKAILISATGSGKTYLSAFDVNEFKPKKCLFVVHSNNILESAKKTFENVIKDKSMGIFNGEKKDIDVDYVFANISSISKDDTLNYFDQDEFDYIIIDEVHKAGADSYVKVLNYFTPKFLLGMSATPERNDEFNVYELFDYNVAYEIRMKEAINENLIVPFHYYGVTDIYDNENNEISIKNVNIKERVENLLSKSEIYGYDGDKIRGLVFVSSVEEAKSIAQEINAQGKKAIALTGLNKTNEREDAIRRISLKVNDENYLDFIVVVDIFNEGIDIPSINQVLLLRETQSKIIYVQQIGRGLRKMEDKEYLVIIDFIANYKNNFLIPSALSGDNSFDLDKVKNIVIDGTIHCPDGCTLEFEKIAQDIVLENISKNLVSGKASLKNVFKEDFVLLEQRLNRMPLLLDFYEANLISPEHIVKIKHKSKVTSYNELVENMFNYDLGLSEKSKFYLMILYTDFSIMKRVHEYVILKSLFKRPMTKEELNEEVEKYTGVENQMFYTQGALDRLSDSEFKNDTGRKNLKEQFNVETIKIIDCNEKYSLVDDFVTEYNGNHRFKLLIDDLVKTNLKFSCEQYKQNEVVPLKIHDDYTRKEIFHIVGDEYNGGTVISGYREFKKLNTVMIFAKLDKSSYDNVLNSPRSFTWMSKGNRTYGKNELETNIADNKLKLQIFLRKTEGENLYYMGYARVESFIQVFDEKSEEPIIKYELQLEKEVPDSLYEYLTSVE